MQAEAPAQTFAEVEIVPQEHVIPGLVPAGLMTVLIAPAKTGKTTVIADWAGRISRGDVPPGGGQPGPAAPVVLCALEDSASRMAEKLKAARADMSMVVNAAPGPDGEGFELSLDHMAWLRGVIDSKPGTRLVVVDTLTAAATSSITSVASLRKMLKPVSRLAEDTGAGVVIVAHTRKDGKPAGSQALIDIPRHVLLIERSVSNPSVRTINVHASNVVGEDAGGLRYVLTDSDDGPRVTYLDEVDTQPGSGPAATGQNKITLLLIGAGKPLSSQEIAGRTGITYPVTRVLLSRLVKKGLIVSTERGMYAIVDPSAAAA